VLLGLLALAVLLGHLRGAVPCAAGSIRASAWPVRHSRCGSCGARRCRRSMSTAALADRRSGTATTDYRYYRTANGDLPALAAAFEPLDYLTRDGPGWDVYMAADWNVFVTAPLFGSRIQNRVWNFLPAPATPPDALLFHTGFGGG
jgi:hypothetical protein